MLEIRIADNGCGVAEDDIHKVFDPYFTTKDIGQGMGLSLAICYALVQGMDGDIGFDNRDTGGTIFWVQLPLDNT
jgi:signal transduction histidine kinase